MRHTRRHGSLTVLNHVLYLMIIALPSAFMYPCVGRGAPKRIPLSYNIIGMRQDYEKLFTYLEAPELPAGLFDRIICAIKREQELRHSKRLLLGFLFLLVASLTAIPFSWTMLAGQVENSGVLYFFSIAVSDFGTFLALWRDFGLAILGSLPIAEIAVFTVSVGMAVFTLRLFLYKKRLLLNYFYAHKL